MYRQLHLGHGTLTRMVVQIYLGLQHADDVRAARNVGYIGIGIGIMGILLKVFLP